MSIISLTAFTTIINPTSPSGFTLSLSIGPGDGSTVAQTEAPSTTSVQGNSPDTADTASLLTPGSSVLPLTTTFIPLSVCYTEYPETSSSGITVWTEGPVESHTQCYPPGYDTVAYYSPGLCPMSWTIVANSTNSINTLTETHATCCPPEMELDPSSTDSMNRPVCSDTFFPDAGFANAVIIAWQSTDFTTPTSTAKPTSTRRVPVETNLKPELSTKNIHSGLSVGAKAGIGVGVSFGVFCAVALIYGLFFLRRRGRVPPQDSSVPSEQAYSDGVNSRPISELPTATFFTPELQAESKEWKPLEPAELDAHR